MASVPNMRLTPAARLGLADQPGDGGEGEGFAQLLSMSVATPGETEAQPLEAAPSDEEKPATGQADTPIAQADAILSLVALQAAPAPVAPIPASGDTAAAIAKATTQSAGAAIVANVLPTVATEIAATAAPIATSPATTSPATTLLTTALPTTASATSTASAALAASTATVVPASGTGPAPDSPGQIPTAPAASPVTTTIAAGPIASPSTLPTGSVAPGGQAVASPAATSPADGIPAVSSPASASAATPTTGLIAELNPVLGSTPRKIAGAKAAPAGKAGASDPLIAAADAAAQVPGQPTSRAARTAIANPSQPKGEAVPASAPTQPAAPNVPPLAPASISDPAATLTAATGPAATDIAAPEAVIERQLDLAGDAEWLDQLARDIANAGSSEGRMRFRLDPEHLGRLQVELTQSERGTSVRLLVDNEAARSILADAQPKLAAEARAQGVRLAETHIDFAGGQAGDPRRHEAARRDPQLRTVRETPTPAEPERPSHASSDRYA